MPGDTVLDAEVRAVLNAARDEVERAHALADIYREERGEAVKPG